MKKFIRIEFEAEIESEMESEIQDIAEIVKRTIEGEGYDMLTTCGQGKYSCVGYYTKTYMGDKRVSLID